ncbi:MAG: DegT/DnrJ/EryC1/StrS family aminotransferase [Pseudomonadota bacterium]
MALSSAVEAKPAPEPIAFIDLKAQQARIRGELERAMMRVLDHGGYIMGPEVKALEAELAAHCGCSDVISCSSGTDALLMIMMAQGIGPGDAVICPAFTFTATPEVIPLLGATPVFADVRRDTFNIDVDRLEDALGAARDAGLKPKALVAVDLFGQAAEYDKISAFAAEHGLWVLADAAQGFGASIGSQRVGTFGLATATSFFPAKPLGCYGDGGAIFTDDAGLAERLRSIRVHGKGNGKYDNVRIGVNGRLDTVQAAVLLEKLKIFTDEVERRNAIAARYTEALEKKPGLVVPRVLEGYTSVWAQYTLRIESGQRDAFAHDLKEQGVPTAIYYPKPVHQQVAYDNFPAARNGLPAATALSDEVISLPMHPYLTPETQDRIISAVTSAVRG